MTLSTGQGATFPNLEPHHSLHDRINPDGNRVLVVVCPFTKPEDGLHFESPWDHDDGTNDMVSCLFCEWLLGGMQHPSHGSEEGIDGDR